MSNVRSMAARATQERDGSVRRSHGKDSGTHHIARTLRVHPLPTQIPEARLKSDPLTVLKRFHSREGIVHTGHATEFSVEQLSLKVRDFLHANPFYRSDKNFVLSTKIIYYGVATKKSRNFGGPLVFFVTSSRMYRASTWDTVDLLGNNGHQERDRYLAICGRIEGPYYIPSSDEALFRALMYNVDRPSSQGSIRQASDNVPPASFVAIPDVRVLDDYVPLNSTPNISPDAVPFETLLISDHVSPDEGGVASVALLHAENASALCLAKFAPIALTLTPRHHISDAGESGLGLFATTNIARGELVLRERPLIVYPQMLPFYSTRPAGQQYPELERAMELMSPDKQEAFFGLMNAQQEEPSLVKGIIDTNALYVGSLPGAPHQYAGVCEHISRINHSCSPNAAYRFDLAAFAFEVRALFPIRPGEQVSIAYTDPALPRAARQHALLSSYGFTCACPVCSLPSAALSLSEMRRRLIARADADAAARDAALARWACTPSLPDAHGAAGDATYVGLFEAERLYYEPVWEGFVGRLCRAACARGDAEGAQGWAALAADVCRAYTGEGRGWDAVAAGPERTGWWGVRARAVEEAARERRERGDEDELQERAGADGA
ncbi:SET domain-containing protein [Dichomitus squalens]|uniref:SET domain-containing protein n=1 Tax=Dichomitus squalens TaxID=114155 RepID=A0A4Q9MEG0_9APHY|nr:SET domain-containing protein [Dichomitus squalens]